MKVENLSQMSQKWGRFNFVWIWGILQRNELECKTATTKWMGLGDEKWLFMCCIVSIELCYFGVCGSPCVVLCWLSCASVRFSIVRCVLMDLLFCCGATLHVQCVLVFVRVFHNLSDVKSHRTGSKRHIFNFVWKWGRFVKVENLTKKGQKGNFSTLCKISVVLWRLKISAKWVENGVCSTLCEFGAFYKDMNSNVKEQQCDDWAWMKCETR